MFVKGLGYAVGWVGVGVGFPVGQPWNSKCNQACLSQLSKFCLKKSSLYELFSDKCGKRTLPRFQNLSKKYIRWSGLSNSV